VREGKAKQDSEESDDETNKRKNLVYNATRLANSNKDTIADDGANVHIFHPSETITDITEMPEEKVKGIGGLDVQYTHKAYHPVLGEGYFDPTAEFTILSIHQMYVRGWRRQISSDNLIAVLRHDRNGTIRLEKDFDTSNGKGDGLYKTNLKDIVAGRIQETNNQALMGTHMTYEKQSRAEKTDELHSLLGHPSDRALKALLQSSDLINCILTPNDVDNMRLLKGRCDICARGKATTHKEFPTYEKRPPLEPGETICMDPVYIAGVEHLILCL
jgi:hypothetical protein